MKDAMRRIAVLFLAVTLLVNVCPVGILAEEEITPTDEPAATEVPAATATTARPPR